MGRSIHFNLVKYENILQILRDLAKFYKVSTNYFFEDMPELTIKEQQQLLRYSTAVANDKEKYIALDLGNPNAMKEYFEAEFKFNILFADVNKIIGDAVKEVLA